MVCPCRIIVWGTKNVEGECPALLKRTSRVLIDTTLAENRDLSFAHPNLNEGGLDTEPLSDDSRIDAEGALFKRDYGHGLRCASKTPREPHEGPEGRATLEGPCGC